MTWIPYVTMFFLGLVGLLLIFIVLLQRGRGGGLAGALGGMGGTSAFGTRAGDVFTKITIGLAIIWTIAAAGNVYALRITGNKYKGGTEAVPTAPAIEPGAGGMKGTEETTPDGVPPSPTDSRNEAPADGTAISTEKPASDAPADSAKPDSK